MAQQRDELAVMPMPVRGGGVARHPAARRGTTDPLRAVPRVGPGTVPGVGGEPPFLKAIPGVTVGARPALPAPAAANAVTALTAPPAAVAAAAGARALPALPKPPGMGAGAIPMGMDPRPRALPPGTGQINMGMDADAGFRTVPRGAAGTPVEPAPRGYEGVNWGPQNPRPGPNEMGATMGAYDRLNQARAASAAAGGGATPSPAPTPEPGAWGKALGVVKALSTPARGIPALVAGVAEEQLHDAVYAGKTPGWVQAVEQDAAKLGQWAQRGIPMTQEDFLAALPAQHEKILAQRGTTAPVAGNPAGAERSPYPGGVPYPVRLPEADPAAAPKADAGDALAAAPAGDQFAWEGGAAPKPTGAKRRVDGGAIKPVMTDQDMADYRALLEQPAAGPGERVGIRGTVQGQPFGIAASTAEGPVSDETKAGLQRVMEGLQSGRYGITPEAVEEGRRWDEARVAETLVKNEQSRVDNHNRAQVLQAAEYRDPLVRAALMRGALEGARGQAEGVEQVTKAGQQPAAQRAAQQTAEAQLAAGVEQERIKAQGEVEKERAKGRGPVTMKYKVGSKQPGGEPLDQEVLYDPLTQQPLFDTGTLSSAAAEHPFGAFEDNADEWEARAKENGYGPGMKGAIAAYKASVAAWKQKYGQGGA